MPHGKAHDPVEDQQAHDRTECPEHNHPDYRAQNITAFLTSSTRQDDRRTSTEPPASHAGRNKAAPAGVRSLLRGQQPLEEGAVQAQALPQVLRGHVVTSGPL
jgi:hypothetical protein